MKKIIKNFHKQKLLGAFSSCFKTTARFILVLSIVATMFFGPLVEVVGAQTNPQTPGPNGVIAGAAGGTGPISMSVPAALAPARFIA